LEKDQFLARKRCVYRVKHLSATDLAETVNKLLVTEVTIAATSGVATSVATVVPDPISNSLVVGAEPDAIDGILDLIEELDRQPQMVSIEVLVAEVESTEESDAALASISDQSISQLALELGKRPGLRTLARPRLAVLDGQSAFLRIGQRASRVTGLRIERTGQVRTTSTSEKVGLSMGFTVRINPDGLITMEIDLDQTDLGRADRGVPIATPSKGEPIYTPIEQTLKTQTTVSLADGQTAVLGQIGTRQGSRPTQLILLVSPRIATTSKGTP
jgi:type II secretory pathway component GspD/PulD (secretin)